MIRWLIIDGNNLIHASPELLAAGGRDFHLARHRLAQKLDEVVNVIAERITVVFDGRGGTGPTGFERYAVEVLFSPPNMTADSMIERMATHAADRDGVTVVSSDTLERHTVEAGGVHTLSCRNFLEELQRARGTVGRKLESNGRKSRKNALGDFFPPA